MACTKKKDYEKKGEVKKDGALTAAAATAP